MAYELAGENAHDAALIYAEQFPERARHPSARIILRVVRQLRKTGCLVHNVRTASAVVQCNIQDKGGILRAFEEDFGANVRRMARKVGVSRYAVHHTLHVNRVYPYHTTSVWKELPRDLQQRINFYKSIVTCNFLYS